MGTQLPSPKGAQPPQFSAHICCGQMDAWIKMPLGMEAGLGPDDSVLDGDPAVTSPKGGGAPFPNFRPTSIVTKRLVDQGGTWHGGGPWSRPHCARWGPSSPSPKRGQSPQFSAYFHCGQTSRCIKMPHGIEVGLSPGHFVLDGDQGPPPIFGPRLLWSNDCMYQDATWYGGRPRFTRHRVTWEPSSPSPKEAQPPIFGQCPLWSHDWVD